LILFYREAPHSGVAPAKRYRIGTQMATALNAPLDDAAARLRAAAL